MDGFPEYKLLQRRLEKLELEMTTLRSDVNTLLGDNRGFRADLDRMMLMIVGDEDLGLLGIVERLRALERASAKVARNQTVVGITSGATFLTLIILRVLQ